VLDISGGPYDEGHGVSDLQTCRGGISIKFVIVVVEVDEWLCDILSDRVSLSDEEMIEYVDQDSCCARLPIPYDRQSSFVLRSSQRSSASRSNVEVKPRDLA
jgi:hypothetical protein